MSKNFDLTTRQGGQAAVKFLKGFDWTDAAAYIALGPLGILANQVRKQVMSSEDQAKVAKDLIKAGRENDVDHMKIKMSKSAAADVGGGFEDVNVKVGGSLGNDVEVDVTYK